MTSLVPPPINKNGCKWVEMVCAVHHPLDSQNKALWSLHTILAGNYYLALLAGREASCPFRFSQAYVSSYFNWYTPEFVLKSTAVGKAPQLCIEASGWTYIFPTGDCMSWTHSLIGWRVYWATVIFSNSQKNYAVARNFCSLLWK